MPGNKPNNKYLFHKFEAANNRERSKSTQASRAWTGRPEQLSAGRRQGRLGAPARPCG